MYSWRHCSIRFSTWKIKTYMPKKGNKKDQDSQILFLIYNTWTKTMVYIFPCHQHSMVGFILKEICSGTPGISIRDIQGSNYHIPHYWIFKKMDRLQWDMKCLPSKATYCGFESGINLSQKIIIIILGGRGGGGEEIWEFCAPGTTFTILSRFYGNSRVSWVCIHQNRLFQLIYSWTKG